MQTDIAIIGAGFSGLSTAYAFAKSGLNITLIDKRASCPNLFRAEKIEADQAALMREFGMLDYRAPVSPVIGETLNYKDGDTTPCDTIEQYGITYGDTVNSLSRHLPSHINRLQKLVSKIDNSVTKQILSFEDGTTLEAKVVVIATGGTAQLTKALGISRLYDHELRSLSFGFDIARKDGQPFDFSGRKGFNYFINSHATNVHYITIFPIDVRMRVNLFTNLFARDELAKQLRTNTIATLAQVFPDIYRQIGEIDLASEVQVMATKFYVLNEAAQPGIVIIGDECQGVNPVTGTGLSKILNDVKALTLHLPRWIDAGRADKQDIAAYYNDPIKKQSDIKSLNSWLHYHNDSLDNKLTLTQRFRQRLMLNGIYSRLFMDQSATPKSTDA